MTNLPQTLTVSDARANLYDIIDQVSQSFKRFSITRNGIPAAVIISAEELESWEETLEIMSNKKLYCQILHSFKQAKRGQTIPFETVLQKSLGHK